MLDPADDTDPRRMEIVVFIAGTGVDVGNPLARLQVQPLCDRGNCSADEQYGFFGGGRGLQYLLVDQERFPARSDPSSTLHPLSPNFSSTSFRIPHHSKILQGYKKHSKHYRFQADLMEAS
jgi:hypothetical protein